MTPEIAFPVDARIVKLEKRCHLCQEFRNYLLTGILRKAVVGAGKLLLSLKGVISRVTILQAQPEASKYTYHLQLHEHS
jgi:hypothetical protein